MTSRASDARVCSPPDSADGGLAHSSRVNPSPRQRALDPLVERVAAEDLVLVQELGVGVVGDRARRAPSTASRSAIRSRWAAPVRTAGAGRATP